MKTWELTLSAKGQVTLPKELREALNLNPGDRMVYTLVDGEVVITPKNTDFADLAGLLGTSPNGFVTLEAIDAGVAQAAGAGVLETNRTGKKTDAAA